MGRRTSKVASSLFWLVLVLALGSYVYYDQKQRTEKKQREERESYLFKLDEKRDPSKESDRKELLKKISKLELQIREESGSTTKPTTKSSDKSERYRTIVAQRVSEKSWEIVKPIRTPGDNVEIRRILEDLIQAKSDRVVEEWSDKKPDFKKYGLHKPSHKASFIYDKVKYQLFLGKKNEFADKYYAYVPGVKRIVMVDTSLYYTLDKKLFDLRRKEIFTQRTDEIEVLSITRKSDQLVFEKRVVEEKARPVLAAKDKGKKKEKKFRWMMTLPVQAWADDVEVDNLINVLKNLRANEFVSEDAKADGPKYGLDQPDYIIEVTLKDKTKMTLNIKVKKEGSDKNVYAAAAIGGPIAKLSDYFLSDLDKKPYDFRDKKVLHFDRNAVRSLVVESGGERFQILKLVGKEDQWRVMAPGPRSGDKDKIDSLLDHLVNLKVKKFVKELATKKDLEKYALVKPGVTVTLYGKDKNDILDILYIGKAEGDGYYATDKDKKRVVFISKDDFEKIPLQAWKVVKDGKPPTTQPTTKKNSK